MPADACPGALAGWSSVEAADGSTAADFAARSGGHSINAMIQRKLEGQPSGLQDQSFQFDPETGEWLDQDSEPAPFETLPSLDRTSKGSILSPEASGSPKAGGSSTSVNSKALPAKDELQQLIAGVTGNNSMGLASHSSGQVVDGGKSDEFDVDDALCMGLHERSSAKSKVNGLHDNDGQPYLQQKVYSSKTVPKVFDSRAALLSSAVVALVGGVALGARYCLESYGA